jgi:hypothetical protein
MDYTIALADEQLRPIVKPFVDAMLEEARRLFPDADFQYTPDEFVRDTPGKYYLLIRWEYDMLGFYVQQLEIMQPQGLDTLTLPYEPSKNVVFHPNWPLVIDLFLRQIEANEIEGYGCGPHLLRLTW